MKNKQIEIRPGYIMDNELILSVKLEGSKITINGNIEILFDSPGAALTRMDSIISQMRSNETKNH